MELHTRHELLHAAMAHATDLGRFLRAQVADAHDAQDLMQELYLSILKLQRADGIRNVKAYLFTIAARLAYQHREQRKTQLGRIPLEELPTEALQAADTGSETNAPESAAALAERLEGLEHRLNELSPKVQAAIVWHHRDGYTCDEIAQRLSVVRHRVKKYLVKGLNHCRTSVA
jgi:RNA polymerase sigma factor (sigma-70 family)